MYRLIKFSQKVYKPVFSPTTAARRTRTKLKIDTGKHISSIKTRIIQAVSQFYELCNTPLYALKNWRRKMTAVCHYGTVVRRLNGRCPTRCDCGCADLLRLVSHRMGPDSEVRIFRIFVLLSKIAPTQNIRIKYMNLYSVRSWQYNFYKSHSWCARSASHQWAKIKWAM